MTRGYTLVELLVVAVMVAIVVGATVQAYMTGITFEASSKVARTADFERQEFENELTQWVGGAYVSSDAADTASVFISQAGSEAESAASGDGSPAITFTTLAGSVPGGELRSPDEFETLNQRYGPQGGLAEVSISASPIGNTDRQGLFLREQRPADGDPTQGGQERLLDSDIREVRFEFWNGTAWQLDWDTRAQTVRRLPSAVRVTYRRDGEEDSRVLVIRLPNSDVTPDSPLEVNG